MSNEPDTSDWSESIRASMAFRNAISGIPTHNFLNEAYHRAGMHHLSPPYDWHWRVPASVVPRAVRLLLNAAGGTDDLVNGLLKAIVDAREVVEANRPHLDVETTRRIHYSPDGPHPWVHPSVKVERHEMEGYAPGWDYTFNVYDLATVLLDDYEKFIVKTMRGRRSMFTKIAMIHRLAEAFAESVRLADPLLVR
jgi:hypothetical protein